MAWDDNAEDIATILRNLGYYQDRVLQEGDPLIGKPCCRNGCTEFEVGDFVHPMLVSTTKQAVNGGTMYVHRGLHVEHMRTADQLIQTHWSACSETNHG